MKLQKNEKKEIIIEKDIDNPLINKSLLESHSNDSKILSELKNIDKNDKENKDLSKSLSEINRKISEEDKKSISLSSESNLIPFHPLSKRIIVQINQLSQRVTKVENENEDNNRIMMKELRLKYFPTKKFNKRIEKNYTIFNENKIKNTPIKLSNNLKSKNINSVTYNKTELNKKLLKQNLILEDTNEKKPYTNNIKNNIINSDTPNINKEYFDKQKIFLNTLKEDMNYYDSINPIQKKELLNFSNDKDKIIFLLDKNRELTDAFRNIFEKYKILKNEYIELYKNINNIEKPNLIEDNDEYKRYLNKENKNIKIKLENYEHIFLPLINYINDLNEELNLKKINYIDFKKYINTYDSKKNDNKNNKLNTFINLLKGNKEIIIKRKKYENYNLKSNNKLLNKIRSNSNFNDFNNYKENLLTNTKGPKYKIKKYYDKI